jgi:hypothetical protein
MDLGSRTIACLLLAVAAAAPADEVRLKGGGRVSGVVVERTPTAVVIETGPGRVTLPMSRVERIVEGRSTLAAYRERAAQLTPADAAGWADLARWAGDRGLLTQAREAWQRVLAADPAHAEANAALGRVEVDGSWLSQEDGYRVRGYVPFEGRWVTPAEHDALVRERAAEEASARDRREAVLRVREAEARAREAEARAREAEAAAQTVDDGGIPYWWGWGGGPAYPPVDPWPPEPLPDPPAVRPDPPGTPPSSIGPLKPRPAGSGKGVPAPPSPSSRPRKD